MFYLCILPVLFLGKRYCILIFWYIYIYMLYVRNIYIYIYIYIYSIYIYMLERMSHIHFSSGTSNMHCCFGLFVYLKLEHPKYLPHVGYQRSTRRSWLSNMLFESHVDLDLDFELSFFMGSILWLYQIQGLIIKCPCRRYNLILFQETVHFSGLQYIYIYIYIYILSSTDRLFRSIRTLQFG